MADAKAVRARLDPTRFDLDLDAIDAAIGPRTGMVIVNSPHNPTGRVYSRSELEALADLLERASARIGRRIFLLSDEPYRRIRFDGIGFTSPAAVYPWTLIDYSYGKVLLAPGQRLGYLAVSPLMPEPERAALRGAMFSTQMALGWTFPNAVMQYAVPDLEHLSIDMSALTRRRDRVLSELEPLGYEFAPPEGTFYLFGKAPGGDDTAFFNALADRDVFVMPGAIARCRRFASWHRHERHDLARRAGYYPNGRVPVVWVRCRMRRAPASKALRRCRVQRLSQMTRSPTRQFWTQTNRASTAWDHKASSSSSDSFSGRSITAALARRPR